jgi:hypothetical protein
MEYSQSEGRVSYSLTYTNSLELDVTNKSFWTYSNSKTYEGLSSILTEEGTILGGEILDDVSDASGQSTSGSSLPMSSTKKYQLALDKFTSIKSEIKDRCKKIDDGKNLIDSTEFKLISFAVTHGYQMGSIKYNYKYSNDLSLKMTSDEDYATKIRKDFSEDSTVEDAKISSNFTLFGQDKYELLQESNSIRPKSLIKKQTMNGLSNLTMLDYLTSFTIIPITANQVLQALNFTFSLKNREFVGEYSILELVDGINNKQAQI